MKNRAIKVLKQYRAQMMDEDCYTDLLLVLMNALEAYNPNECLMSNELLKEKMNQIIDSVYRPDT